MSPGDDFIEILPEDEKLYKYNPRGSLIQFSPGDSFTEASPGDSYICAQAEDTLMLHYRMHF